MAAAAGDDRVDGSITALDVFGQPLSRKGGENLSSEESGGSFPNAMDGAV